jgi:hypothetical protein
LPETLSQPMAALERANEKRTEVSNLKQRVRSGELPVSEVVLNPPACFVPSRERRATPITVATVLSWQSYWGRTRAQRFLYRLGIPPELPLHHLTRERRRLVASKLPKT